MVLAPGRGGWDTEARAQFDDQLRQVRSDVVRLAALVGECIPRGTEALVTCDRDAVENLRESDEAIDRLAARIETAGCRLLALQQPVAGDLRLVVTALRMAYELERIGDLIVDAASTVDGWGPMADARARGLVELLGELTLDLLRQAVDAYADGDPSVADRVAPVMGQVVDTHGALTERLRHTAQDGAVDVQAAVGLALVGRCYERAAKHAFNIAGRVRYVVSGTGPVTQPRLRTESA